MTQTTMEHTKSQSVTDEKTRTMNVLAKAAVRNINTGKVVEEFDVNKNAEGVKQHDKKVTTPKAEKPVKEAKPTKDTIASRWDTILIHGGKWVDLVAKAQQASKELGGTMKVSVGSLRAHAAYRLKKDSKYLGQLVLTAEGIGKPVKASNKK